MDKILKVVVLSENGEVETKEVANKYEEMSKLVAFKGNGLIEFPLLSEYLFEHGILTMINEEGKLLEGMPISSGVATERQGQLVDLIYGNVVFMGKEDENGDVTSLTDEQLTIISNFLFYNTAMTFIKNEPTTIIVFPLQGEIN